MPRRSAIAGAFVALLAGCGALSDRGGEDSAPTRLSATGQTIDEVAFPNLGSVSGQPPAISSVEERQAITDGLEADRAKGRSGAGETGGADDQGGELPDLDALAPSGGGALPAGPGDQAAALPPGGDAVTVDLGAIDAVAEPLPAAMRAPPPGGSEPTAGFSAAALSPMGPSPGDLSPEGLSPVALIYFDNGSAALSPRGRAVLRDVALLQNRRGATVRIVGHASMRTRTTDSASHEAVNRAISLRRAKAVARELVRLGVPAGRMTVAAAGDTEPIYYEFMPSGEAGNRRVAIYFLH